MDRNEISLEIENPAGANEIFDSHAHYDDERFDSCRDDIIESLKSLGVGGIINCAVNLQDSASCCLRLSENHDICYTAIGVHPLNLTDGEFSESVLRKLLENKKVVAVGEIGLDYHYTPETRNQQLELLRRQIIVANELSLPIIFHDRDAHEDTLNILKELKPAGVVHCFSGSAEMAKEIIELGMYIGMGGAVTFSGAKKPCRVMSEIPLDRLLLETDAPYLAPVPYRGKTCHSAQIVRVAEKIAEIRNDTRENIMRSAVENTKTLFGIK